MPHERARSRANAPGTLLTTRTTWAGTAPPPQPSMMACRFDPVPETSTPTRSRSGIQLYPPRIRGDGADDPRALPEAVEVGDRRLPLLAGDDEEEAEPHVERPKHLVIGDLPPLLDERKHGRHRPPISADDRPAPGRQDPHQIARDPPAGDMGDAANLDVPPKGEYRAGVRPVGPEERPAERFREPRGGPVEREAGRDLPRGE